MATPKQVVFLDFSWNLMVAFTSSTLEPTSSLAFRTVGNLPALLRPGPNRRGILRMRVAEAMNAWNSWANFFTSFLFLLSFCKSATDLEGIPAELAFSMSLSFPITQTVILSLGTLG